MHKEQSVTLVKIVVALFMLLELSNVLALYFAPGSKYANAVGVFTAWEASKRDPRKSTTSSATSSTGWRAPS